MSTPEVAELDLPRSNACFAPFLASAAKGTRARARRLVAAVALRTETALPRVTLWRKFIGSPLCGFARGFHFGGGAIRS
jgi:hypothetical protein